MFYTDEEDESCVAAFTALPRTKWAEVRKRLEENPVNKRILKFIDSALTFIILQSNAVDCAVSNSVVFFSNGISQMRETINLMVTNDLGLLYTLNQLSKFVQIALQ